MTWLKSTFWQKILALSLAFVIVSFIAFPLKQVAQDATQRRGSFQEAVSRPRSAPTTPPSSDGAGRGDICTLAENANGQSIQASVGLMPVEQADLDKDNLVDARYVGGKTIIEHPTFWFYIPYIAKPASKDPENRVAQFVLLDTAKQPIWHELVAFELSQTPQLIEYTLPYALELDQAYSWYFSVVCDPEKPSRNSTLRGWVQRVKPSPQLQNALATTPIPLLPEYEFKAYVEDRIWFEALNFLVEKRRQFPNDIRYQEDLISLLAEVVDISEPGKLDFINPAEIKDRE